MDFAAESVLDTFTPLPPRAAARPVAQTDESGPTFEEHLDAVNDTAPKREAQSETTPEASSTETVNAKPEADAQEPVDPDVALLGGPSVAPPLVAAPVMVQMAMAQLEQTHPDQQPTGDASAPATAPQAPAPSAPPMGAERLTSPSAPEEPTEKTPGTEARTPETRAKPETAFQTSTAQSQPAPAPTTIPQTSLASMQEPQTPPISVEQLPSTVQQAIAATTAPVPQAQSASAQRAKAATTRNDAKEATQGAATKIASEAPNSKARTGKADVVPATAKDATLSAPLPATTETPQIAQTSTVAAAAAQASSHAQQIPSGTDVQRTGSVATQVGREIVRRFDGGNTSFEIRLDPAELGRVEVRMEVSRDHRVTAVITADSPQALTELARHARELESQLQSAGLQLSDNGLSFDLRQQTNGRDTQEAGSSQRVTDDNEAAAEQQKTAQTARPVGFERWRGVRVDMMV